MDPTPRLWLAVSVIAAALAAPGPSLPAQRSPGVDIQVVPGTATVAGPLVTTVGVLRDHRETIQHGFAARLNYSVTLWRQQQWADPRIDDAAWTLIVEFNPMSKEYFIRVDTVGRSARGPFLTLEQVDSALALPLPAPIRAPADARRMYYSVKLDIQPISWNELDELEAWLRGDVRPATRGQANPVQPVVGIIRRFVLSVFGGRRTSYSADSETFVPVLPPRNPIATQRPPSE